MSTNFLAINFQTLGKEYILITVYLHQCSTDGFNNNQRYCCMLFQEMCK